MLDLSRVQRRCHEFLAESYPIVGVSGLPPDKIRLDFEPDTPQDQQDAAYAALNAFDWTDEAAHEEWEAAKRRRDT